MRLYFVRIFPILFALGITYHLHLIDLIEEAPHTEINWRKDLLQQDPLFLRGEALFKRNCSTCHGYLSKRNIGTAPNLKGVQMRWIDYPKTDLYNFIRNSQKMIKEEHPKAVKVGKQWDGVMTAYPGLSVKDIESMLHFIEKETYGEE